MSLSIVQVYISSTLDPNYCVYLCDCSSADRTITISEASEGQQYYIKNNNGSNNCYVVPDAGELLDSGTSTMLGPNQHIHIVSDGSNWFSI